MNNVLKFAIEQATGHDIVKEAFDYAQNASTQIDREYVADHLKMLFDGAAKDPVVLNAMIDDACDSVAQNALTRCKNINWIDKEGNIDWTAFRTSFISLGEGKYIKVEYATIEALRTKSDQQKEHLDKAIAKSQKYSEVMEIIIPVMEDHDFETAGEAVEFMGL